MGEQDEKETAPTEPQQEAEEPKETDKMLEKKDEPTETVKPAEDETARSSPVQQQDAPKIAEEKKKEANGEEIIKMPEASETTSPVTQEGREVKPKKIPIGGIKMPGFFTKSKPRGEGDGADGELLEKEDNDNKANEEKPKDDKKTLTIGERIRNFFSKKSSSQPAPMKLENETKDVKNENADGTEEQPPKKGLLNAIKLPIANMIPKKKTETDDVELGNGPGTKAGLASMETLDDSLKDQDTVDKAKSHDDGLETLKLTDEKKDEDDEGEVKPTTCFERIRTYKCSIDDFAIAGGIIVFIILVALICIITFTGDKTKKTITDGRFIQAVTSCGMAEGMVEDGAYAFRGIPYAVPPIDEYRFQPAILMEEIEHCWNGTFKAHNATDVCIQVIENGTVVGTEDCLTLDVITPYVRYENPLPVVVLIGTESLTGGSPGILRPSARYAKSREVVFVRPNFRLGPFGFLSTELLSKSTYPPSSGNYALSDILTALNWIRLNIAHFGGDPKSVILFGHRAGATLVSSIITSSQATDLYARAWVTSGAAVFPGRPLGESERRNSQYNDLIKCNDIECLRNATAEEVLDAVPDTWRRDWQDLPRPDENTTTRHEWLVLDGQILKEHVVNVWNNEQPKIIIGTTAHESHSQTLFLKQDNWTAEAVRKHIEESKIGRLNLTDEVIKRYNATYQGLVAMISDIRTVCPLLTIAKVQHSIPFYVVKQGRGDLDLADVDSDVQAILGRYEPHTVQQRRYVSAMQQLFYHFVAHGKLPQFESRRKILQIEQDALPIDQYPNCDFWISNDIVPRYARID